MTATEFKKLLTKLGACREAVEWAKGKNLKTVWETCEHGDWLLWLVGNMVGTTNWPTHKQVVLAACACAETSLKYVPKDELRPKQAIDTVRRWANGKATIEEVRKAAWAAWAAEAAGAARAAAGAAWAAWAAEAAGAAWAAARAAEAARAAVLKDCADLVRHELTPFMQEVLK